MRQPPSNTIAPEAIKAWKITAWIYMGVLWLVTAGLVVCTFVWEISWWFPAVSFLVSSIGTYLCVYLFPTLRWRRWRYEIFQQEIYIQHGILIVSRTLIPMIRVQHVDTKQGPILKKYQLASLTISSAATTHEIPALLEEDASELRDRISALARVEEDDV